MAHVLHEVLPALRTAFRNAPLIHGTRDEAGRDGERQSATQLSPGHPEPASGGTRGPAASWASYWGEELAQWADVVALRENGFEVEPLGNGWLLWPTPKITDVRKDFDSFSARRVEAKRHFFPGLFIVPG